MELHGKRIEVEHSVPKKQRYQPVYSIIFPLPLSLKPPFMCCITSSRPYYHALSKYHDFTRYSAISDEVEMSCMSSLCLKLFEDCVLRCSSEFGCLCWLVWLCGASTLSAIAVKLNCDNFSQLLVVLFAVVGLFSSFENAGVGWVVLSEAIKHVEELFFA